MLKLNGRYGPLDPAILSVGLQVGLRHPEIAALKVGDLHQERFPPEYLNAIDEALPRQVDLWKSTARMIRHINVIMIAIAEGCR